MYEDLATFRDRGDEISNELVLSCPYFRNEVSNLSAVCSVVWSVLECTVICSM